MFLYCIQHHISMWDHNWTAETRVSEYPQHPLRRAPVTMPEPCTAAAPPPGGAGGRLAGGWWAVGGGTSAARRLPASARAVGRCARLGAHTVAGIGGAWAWAAWAGRVAAGGRLASGWWAAGGWLAVGWRAARVRCDGCRPARGQWGGARGLVCTRWPVLVVRGRGPRGRGGWRLVDPFMVILRR